MYLPTVGSWEGGVSYGRGTPVEGLHVAGQHRDEHAARMLQACGLGSSQSVRVRRDAVKMRVRTRVPR